MSDSDHLQEYLEFGTRLVRDSGDIALRYFRSDLDISNKQEGEKFDPVTAADTEVEEYIRTGILERFPDHGVIGEEAGESNPAATLKWLVDPIDGTRGFVAGTPMWGTLLGLLDGDRTLAGFLNQPFIGETFIGSEQGTFIIDARGQRQIHTSTKQELSDAVLACTHLSMYHSGKALDRFIRIAETCRFSRFGTDCYGYAMLAHGFIDIIVEGNLKAYDVAPLIPIVEGAGGVISNWQGESVEQGGDVVAAANAELHHAALKFLAR